MAQNDLSDILNSWQYDPDHTVRIVIAEDGRSVLQVRLPLGIEQYELEGRPDGETPNGYPTVLARIEDSLTRYVVQHGNDAGFRITSDDARALHTEAILFYYRYLLLYQMSYNDLVVADTQHNLDICDLMERYCPSQEWRESILQFRPYIMRMNAAARIRAIAGGELDGDVDSVANNAIAAIEALDEIDRPSFQMERVRSVNYLRSLQQKVAKDENSAATPQNEQERLNKELGEAVEKEDYERAAWLRDQIRRVDKES